MNSIKQMIRTGAATLCAVCLLNACSSTLDEALDGGNTAQALTNIQIGDFPVFGSEANNGTQTRSAAIGTYDEGKTEWENGDEILLKITDSKSEATTATLVYDGTKWAPSTSLSAFEGKASIEAYYAPAYEWKNNELTLKTDKVAGTEEYLTYSTSQELTDGLIITFARNYGRLRVATEANSTITLTAAGFTPAGTTATLGGRTLSTIADVKGNAYFYGTWTASSSASVKSDVKITYGVYKNYFTLPEAYVAKSYAIAGLAKWGFDASCYHSWDAASLPEDCPTAQQMISYLEAGYYWDDAVDVLDGQKTFSIEKDGVHQGTFHTGLWLLKKEHINNFDNINATLPYTADVSKKPTSLKLLTPEKIKTIRTGGKYFFLPAAGAYNMGQWGKNCIYWSKTADGDKNSYWMYVTSSYAEVGLTMKTYKLLPMIAE